MRLIYAITSSAITALIYAVISFAFNANYPFSFSLLISAIAGMNTLFLTLPISSNYRTLATFKSFRYSLVVMILTLTSMIITMLPVPADMKYVWFYVSVFCLGFLLTNQLNMCNDFYEFVSLSALLGYSVTVIISLIANVLGRLQLAKPTYLVFLASLVLITTLRKSHYSKNNRRANPLRIIAGMFVFLVISLIVVPWLNGNPVRFPGWDIARFYMYASVLERGFSSSVPLSEIGFYSFLLMGRLFASNPSIEVMFTLDNMLWLFPAMGMAFIISRFYSLRTTIASVVAYGCFSSFSWVFWLYSQFLSLPLQERISFVDLAFIRITDYVGAGLNFNQPRPDPPALLILALAIGYIIDAMKMKNSLSLRKSVVLTPIVFAAFISHPIEVVFAFVLTGLFVYWYRQIVYLYLSLIIGMLLSVSFFLIVRPTFGLAVIISVSAIGAGIGSLLIGRLVIRIFTKMRDISRRLNSEVKVHLQFLDLETSIVLLPSRLLYISLFIVMLTSPFVWIHEFLSGHLSPPYYDPFNSLGLMPWFMFTPIMGMRAYLIALGFYKLSSLQTRFSIVALLLLVGALFLIPLFNYFILPTGYNMWRLVTGPGFILLALPLANGIARLQRFCEVYDFSTKTTLVISSMVLIVIFGTLSIEITKAIQYFRYFIL